MDSRNNRAHNITVMRWAVGISVAAVIVAVVYAIINYTDFPTLLITLAIALGIGYVLTSSIFTIFADEDSFAADVFCCSIRGFTMPGLIFELDLDGIIWFICVKLLLSILSLCLSVFWFVGVMAFGAVIAALSFPFVAFRALRT